ncbi:MAG: glycosyltransferase family 4 protein [Pirellulaceae bacterium]|jgi:glycosyltransferase involved in cell wall biosynthesis|nr:glycosyltransferase family 4 protein [Pirellulaceae bacterium]HJN12949.1 glycosyltransferase family 4 protein [Pirellulaceae bacterium]
MSRRIALLFEYPTLNGGERSMLQTLELLDSREFEIIALAPSVGRLAEALRTRSIQHVPFDLRDADDVRLPREQACEQLVESIRNQAPDLLHANSLSMGRITGAAAEKLAIPCVAHLRDIIGLSRTAIDDLNRNRTLIAVSHATREFHIAQGLSAARTRVMHNGVDADRFQPRPKTLSLCHELKVPETSFIVITIGQIGLRKGQDVLAAAALAIAEGLSQVQFVIVGERNSSKDETIAYEANMESEFARACLGDRLHQLGYRDDVDHLMNEADLLVHPAKQEPLGRVLLEAAASGLPIVATNVGGTTEIVTDGTSARLVAPNNHVQLAGAVIGLATDKRLRDRLADAARQRVTSDFTPRAVADNLTKVWRQALAD